MNRLNRGKASRTCYGADATVGLGDCGYEDGGGWTLYIENCLPLPVSTSMMLLQGYLGLGLW